MKVSDQVLDVEKVVLNAAVLQESTLAVGDELLHLGCNPSCQHLPKKLGHTMCQTDGTRIRWPQCVVLLRDERDVGRVQQISAGSVESS